MPCCNSSIRHRGKDLIISFGFTTMLFIALVQICNHLGIIKK